MRYRPPVVPYKYFAGSDKSILYRIGVPALNDETLPEKGLGARVEKFADITMCDGIITDDAGNIYLTDMEHAAIHRVDPKGNLQTLFKDSKKLRWPDGFGFGPGGVLYFTDSALQDVMTKSAKHIQKCRPYYIYRFHPRFPTTASH